MAQYLLVSFDQHTPNSAGGKNLRDVIQDHCTGIGVMKDFKISTELAHFTTQDQLYKVATDLEKLDTIAYSLLTRITRSCYDISQKIQQDFAVGFKDICNGEFGRPEPPSLQIYTSDSTESTDEYIQSWEWNDSLFIANVPINNLYDRLSGEIQEYENQLRAHQAAFTEAGNRITTIRRRGEGSLLVRSLDEIGSSLYEVTNLEDYRATKASQAKLYVNTRNLTTILVVVKKSNSNEFLKNYAEQPYVVPKSAAKLEEDSEFACFAVTIRRDNIDDYKMWTKNNNYHIREFKYNRNMRDELTRENQVTVDAYVTQCSSFADHLDKAFSHIFEVWIHIKALRVFTESTLQYGIPPKFQSFLLQGSPKNLVKIAKALDKTFADGLDDGDDTGESEYHPYVCYLINTTSFSKLQR